MFVAGHYYGCICLVQSVAEGLARFIAEKNGMRPPRGFETNVEKLRKRHLISQDVADALLSIHGKDRNDFHHLNKKIEQDHRKLEARAEECLQGLLRVESEVFAFEYGDDGTINVKHRKYWDIDSDGNAFVYVRFL